MMSEEKLRRFHGQLKTVVEAGEKLGVPHAFPTLETVYKVLDWIVSEDDRDGLLNTVMNFTDQAAGLVSELIKLNKRLDEDEDGPTREEFTGVLNRINTFANDATNVEEKIRGMS